MTNKEFLSVVEFLFCIAEPIINVLDPPKKTGRPRVPTRDAFEVILRKFYTGIGCPYERFWILEEYCPVFSRQKLFRL